MFYFCSDDTGAEESSLTFDDDNFIMPDNFTQICEEHYRKKKSDEREAVYSNDDDGGGVDDVDMNSDGADEDDLIGDDDFDRNDTNDMEVEDEDDDDIRIGVKEKDDDLIEECNEYDSVSFLLFMFFFSLTCLIYILYFYK